MKGGAFLRAARPPKLRRRARERESRDANPRGRAGIGCHRPAGGRPRGPRTPRRPSSPRFRDAQPSSACPTDAAATPWKTGWSAPRNRRPIGRRDRSRGPSAGGRYFRASIHDEWIAMTLPERCPGRWPDSCFVFLHDDRRETERSVRGRPGGLVAAAARHSLRCVVKPPAAVRAICGRTRPRRSSERARAARLWFSSESSPATVRTSRADPSSGLPAFCSMPRSPRPGSIGATHT